MSETSTSKPSTSEMAAAPLCGWRQRGMSLAELLIYVVILGVVLLAVYQARDLLFRQGIGQQQVSILQTELQIALDRLRAEARLSEEPVRILNQSQAEGAPASSGVANCLQMLKTVNGVPSIYAISLRWEATEKASRLVLQSHQGCDRPPGDSATPLSGAIFAPAEASAWFTGLGAAQSNGGFREVDFNYRTTLGKGMAQTGTTTRSLRLGIGMPTPPACRIASPDASWFTDFGGQLIRTVTVSFTLNFDATADRLALLGTHPGVTATPLDALGVLHLHATSGLRVRDWLDVLSDVQYTRAADAVPVTDATPPRRLSFVLGDGLSFAPAGTPSPHFYLAIQLTNASNFNTADTLAKGMCYPAFASDSFLGVGARNATTPAAASCDTGSWPRLTGHLVTLSTEGEHEFVRNKVLRVVYPQSFSGASPLAGSSLAPASGGFWMGGYVGSKVSTGGEMAYRWTRGFEMSKDATDANAFANLARVPLSTDAADRYFSSLWSNSSVTPGHNLYFDIAGSSGLHWNAQAGTSTLAYAVVEFGDNRNASGGNQAGDEIALNSALRLKKDVTVVPAEFFRTCQ